MKWMAHKRVKVDRVACPRPIKSLVDPEATFYFVSAEWVMSEAARPGV